MVDVESSRLYSTYQGIKLVAHTLQSQP